MKGAALSVPKLRFSGFVGEWEEKRLGNGTTLISGQHLAPEEYTNAANDLPYFTGPSDFTNDPLRLTKWAKKEAKSAKSGDVLLTVKGSGVGELWFLQLPKVAMGRQLMAVRGNGFSAELVYHLLSNRRNQFQALAAGNLIPGLARPDILGMKFNLPTLPEQKKIASFLGVVDAKIAALRVRVLGLQAYKRGLMQALFSQTLRFTKPDGTAFPDWEEKRLGDFCDALSGYPVPGDEILEVDTGVRLLRGVNITEGLVRRSAELDRFHGGNVARLSRFLVEPGDVVIGMDGSKVGKNVAVISDDEAGSFLIQRVTRLRKNSPNSVLYVYFHVISPSFHKYVDMVNTSSGIPHISLQQIKDFEIPMPHPDEQAKIAEALSAMDAKIAAVQGQVDRMQDFKKGLLQQMFV